MADYKSQLDALRKELKARLKESEAAKKRVYDEWEDPDAAEFHMKTDKEYQAVKKEIDRLNNEITVINEQAELNWLQGQQQALSGKGEYMPIRFQEELNRLAVKYPDMAWLKEAEVKGKDETSSDTTAIANRQSFVDLFGEDAVATAEKYMKAYPSYDDGTGNKSPMTLELALSSLGVSPLGVTGESGEMTDAQKAAADLNEREFTYTKEQDAISREETRQQRLNELEAARQNNLASHRAQSENNALSWAEQMSSNAQSDQIAYQNDLTDYLKTINENDQNDKQILASLVENPEKWIQAGIIQGGGSLQSAANGGAFVKPPDWLSLLETDMTKANQGYEAAAELRQYYAQNQAMKANYEAAVAKAKAAKIQAEVKYQTEWAKFPDSYKAQMADLEKVVPGYDPAAVHVAFGYPTRENVETPIEPDYGVAPTAPDWMKTANDLMPGAQTWFNQMTPDNQSAWTGLQKWQGQSTDPYKLWQGILFDSPMRRAMTAAR